MSPVFYTKARCLYPCPVSTGGTMGKIYNLVYMNNFICMTALSYPHCQQAGRGALDINTTD